MSAIGQLEQQREVCLRHRRPTAPVQEPPTREIRVAETMAEIVKRGLR